MKTLLTILLAFSVHILNAQTIPVFTPEKKKTVKPVSEKPKTPIVVKPIAKKKITDGYVENFDFMELKYFGYISQGIPHGKGKLVASDGVIIYEGEFYQGEMNGYGIQKDYNNQLVYEGNFLNNYRNGQGILYLENCSFNGVFKDGIYVSGTITYKDGTKYIGNLSSLKKSDGKNNNGTIVFSNGDKYVGGFDNQRINGWGTYTWANGDKISCSFYFGDILGTGTWTFKMKNGQVTYKTGYFQRSSNKVSISFDDEVTKEHQTIWGPNSTNPFQFKALMYMPLL